MGEEFAEDSAFAFFHQFPNILNRYLFGFFEYRIHKFEVRKQYSLINPTFAYFSRFPFMSYTLKMSLPRKHTSDIWTTTWLSLLV